MPDTTAPPTDVLDDDVDEKRCVRPTGANGDLVVLGRSWDTSPYKGLPRYDVLDLGDAWTQEKNDQWIRAAINRSATVCAASAETPANLRRLSPTRGWVDTVFAIELGQLRNAGYRTVGDPLGTPHYLVP